MRIHVGIVVVVLLGLLLGGVFFLFLALVVELVHFVLLNDVRLQFPHLLTVQFKTHFLCCCD